MSRCLVIVRYRRLTAVYWLCHQSIGCSLTDEFLSFFLSWHINAVKVLRPSKLFSEHLLAFVFDPQNPRNTMRKSSKRVSPMRLRSSCKKAQVFQRLIYRCVASLILYLPRSYGLHVNCSLFPYFHIRIFPFRFTFNPCRMW